MALLNSLKLLFLEWQLTREDCERMLTAVRALLSAFDLAINPAGSELMTTVSRLSPVISGSNRAPCSSSAHVTPAFCLIAIAAAINGSNLPSGYKPSGARDAERAREREDERE